MKRILLLLAFLAAGCGTTIPVTAPAKPTPPAAPASIAFDLVGCRDAVADNYCDGPSGATFTIAPIGLSDTPRVQAGDGDGYTYVTLIPPTWASVTIDVSASGYLPLHATAQTADLVASNAKGVHNFYGLTSSMPSPPSRDEITNVHITFQGLLVDCPPYGQIPLFESGLPWMTPECRANVYAAKHASSAWPGGDTHALVHLPSGPPLYDEPNQPYSADRFGPLDWTAGGTHIDGRLADLVHEVIVAGFPHVLLFEGGDGVNGYPIAMNQLDLINAALSSTPYGDLRPFVVPIPGYDGVFYGWEPSHTLIPNWVNKCRSLFPYCGFEHSTGHIPLGEGDQDWTGSGAMRGIDLLLEEFNDDVYDDSIWQIAARVLGPAYNRPPEQPAGDDPGSPFGANAGQFILRQPTDRGPIVPCMFEFHEFSDVHSNGDPTAMANTVKQRAYLKARGYTCGG